MNELSTWFSLAAAMLSLLGVAYIGGFKLSALETKVDTLWQIYVEDALRRQVRAGNAVIDSMPRPTEGMTALLPADVREMLSTICPGPSLVETAQRISQRISLSTISHLSQAAKCLPSEILAAMAIFCHAQYGEKERKEVG